MSNIITQANDVKWQAGSACSELRHHNIVQPKQGPPLLVVGDNLKIWQEQKKENKQNNETVDLQPL